MIWQRQFNSENAGEGLIESNSVGFFDDKNAGESGYIYAAYYPMFDTKLHYMQYNGKEAKFPFKLVDNRTGISSVNSGSKAVETMRFDAEGRRLTAPAQGLNIVKMSDGTVRKVMVK